MFPDVLRVKKNRTGNPLVSYDKRVSLAGMKLLTEPTISVQLCVVVKVMKGY